MLKCSIFLPFSLEIKTESNTLFSVEFHTKMLVCFLMRGDSTNEAVSFLESCIKQGTYYPIPADTLPPKFAFSLKLNNLAYPLD